MEHYIRTTIIQSGVKIRRERAIPHSGEVSIGVGNEVTPAQVVVRAPVAAHFVTVNASEILGVPPEKVIDYIIIEPDSIVDVDTVLAQKKQTLRNKQLLAPVGGTLFDVVNGRIIIRQSGEWLEIRALLSGRVVSFVGDRGVLIEAHGTLIQGVWGSGKENFGKLKVVARNNSGFLAKDHFNSEVSNLVLAAGRLEHVDVLYLAQEMNVAGVIVGSMTAECYRIAPLVNYPIILTDGVGKQNMSQPIFNLLQQADGKETSLFASYDESRGQRPEVIIPEAVSATSETVTANKPIRVGQTVRILRAPYAGQLGQIARIYTLSQLLATGAKAQGVDVKLADGNEVFIPFANFDVVI